MTAETLQVLVEVPDVLRVHVDATGKRILEETNPLQLLYYPVREAVLLRHGFFIYALQKDVPVFSNTRPDDCVLGKRYVISLGKEQKAFVFSKQVDAGVTRDFEGLINHYAMLLFANDGHEPEWIGNEIYAEESVANEIHKSIFFNKDAKITTAAGVAADTKPKSEYELSEKIGNAFTIGGQFIMKGLSKAGSEAIKKLVGKNDKPVEVQPATVAKFRAASQTTKAVTSFTKAQIGNAIDLAFNLGNQAKDEFVKSDKGAQVTNNKYFIHAKIIGGGMFDLGVGIFAGLENAFTSVAQGTKGMTESVLEHKYGKDVKTVFAHSADTVWDVYQLKNVAKKEIVAKTGTNILDELNSGVYARQPQQPPANAFGATGNAIKK